VGGGWMKRVKALVGVLFVLVIIGCTVSPVSAWGGFTHYSIGNAVKNCIGIPSEIKEHQLDFINGVVVPDIFYGIWGVTVPADWEKLYKLMHYDERLITFVWQEATTDEERAYAAGWITHPISDYYIHDHASNLIVPYPHGKAYLDYKNANTQSEHARIEYYVDCIVYHDKEGKLPTQFVLYPFFIRKCIQDFKNKYGGDFPVPSVGEITNEFGDLMAGYYAEQISFDVLGDYLYNEAKRECGDYKDWWDASVEASYLKLLSLGSYSYSAKKGIEQSFTKVPIKSIDIKRKAISSDVIIAIRKSIGHELIKEGILIPHSKYDKKTSAYILWFESKVSKDKLCRIYLGKFESKLRYLETSELTTTSI
jgi:hypothetical protein